MIVALFALAAIMVIGGSAAVIQGFPFVRLESGLAMVIAGAGTASAGAVLFGLAVVATWLRRVERALGARPAASAAAEPVFAPTFPAPIRSEPATAGIRPTLPGASPLPGLVGGAAAGALGAGLAVSLGGRRQAEPTFEDSLFEPQAPEASPQPDLPLPGLTPVPAETYAEPEPDKPQPDGGLAPEDDLFAQPLDAPPESEDAEPPALRPSLGEADAADVPEPAAAPVPEAAPTPPDAHVAEEPRRKEIVGKHASGGNTYVMFADGSIEAETPQGRYTFDSLDELKAFVDAGGESATRGAA